MKKKLQRDLQHLAEEILDAGSSLSAVDMKQKLAALYEKVTVLAFLEGQLQEDITTASEESFDSKSFREKNWFTEPEPIPQPDHKEDLVEPLMEKIKDLVAQMPPETQGVEKMLEEVLPQKKYLKNDLEEFAKNYQETPTFERKVTSPPTDSTLEIREPAKGVDAPKPSKKLVDDLGVSEKPKSINDTVGDGMRIDLNDRLAYIKHLFGGNSDDYTRVLSQVSTMTSYDEAETFIKTKVKPDYNFWLQKDMYAERFMAAIGRKFN
ncbi:hypothetical protein G5B37_09770 [Rasiella rasia]|uniref:Uncharacterized protein n=1 Tax=Rasiella rasia TaxID=2744027 RepID=A0A6G6GMR1_9FLAO|nr:hypothetical protein [Rasiella rasia]QIE59842.1 hypothetical protein G5B37_09770 [Rasiella rasia]